MHKVKQRRILIAGVLVTLAISFSCGCSCIAGTCETLSTTSWTDGPVEQEWVAHYHTGTSHDEPATAISIDENSDICVTGTKGSVTYNSAGHQLQTSSSDICTGGSSLDIDSAGNTYEAVIYGSSWVTTKRDINGTEIWKAYYDYDSHGLVSHTHYYCCGPVDIAVDASGNVYVTGTSIYQVCSGGLSHIDTGTTFNSEYTTIKYSQPASFSMVTPTPIP